MSTLSQVEKISQKYAVSAEEFIRSGIIMVPVIHSLLIIFHSSIGLKNAAAV